MSDPISTSSAATNEDAPPSVPSWLLNASLAVELAPPERSYLSGSYSRLSEPESSSAPASAARVEPVLGLREASSARESKEDEHEVADGSDAESRPIVARADEERGLRICAGFRIEEMTMRNGDTGAVVWRAASLGADDLFARQLEAVLPASLLRAGSVMRSITFSSKEVMKDFYMVQRLFLGGQLLEEDEFSFGFVIPGSTNTLEQEVEADGEGTLPAEVLSGNLLVQTQFFDKAVLVGSAVVRVLYDTSR